MKQFMWLMVLIFIVSSKCYGVNFEQALLWYSGKNYEEAYSAFLELSELANADAQLNLGVMHYRGEFVKKDLIEAYAWIAVAKANGSVAAEKIKAIVDKKISAENKDHATVRYNALLSEYSNKAVFEKMVPSLEEGPSVNYKPEKIRRKVQPKYPQAMAKMGASGIVDIQFTVDEKGVTRNHIVLTSTNKSFSESALKAIKSWTYFPAEVNGKAVSVYGKGFRASFSIDGNTMEQKKVDRLLSPFKEKAMEGGSQDKFVFARNLDLMKSYLIGKDIELENSNNWYYKSAQYGSSPAKFILGRNILYGYRCTADFDRGLFWLESAAEDNLSDAIYFLGMELMGGTRLEMDFDRGLVLLKKSADNGLPDAILNYAKILASNEKVMNVKESQKYLNRLDFKKYEDKLSYYQVSALVNANLNDYKKALKWQKKALKEAKRHKLPTDDILKMLEDIQAGKKKVYSF